jgi:hypothetical protein
MATALASVLTSGVAAQDCEIQQRAKLISSPSVTAAWFGQSVGMKAERAVVAIPGSDGAGDDSGSADVFVQVGGDWSRQAALTASEAQGGAEFGFAVATSGDWAVVGAPGRPSAGDDSGGAYVFAWNGLAWVERAILIAPDGAPGDRFGSAVAIVSGFGGDRVVVGAIGDDDEGVDAGAAHIFRRAGNSWVQESKLLPGEPNAGQAFGAAVAISSGGDADLVVIGAPGFDGGDSDAGAAYVFRREDMAWEPEAVLHSPAPIDMARFGASVGAMGSTDSLAIVGAPGDVDGGAAFIFRRSGGAWPSPVVLGPSEGDQVEAFGASVSIEDSAEGPRAAVGAPGKVNDSPPGSVWLYRRSDLDWLLETKVVADDGQIGDLFGSSVALDDQARAVVGAPRDDDLGPDAGSAAFLEGSGDGWIPDGVVYPAAAADHGRLGWASAAISGDWALVGTSRDTYNDPLPGEAYLYHRQGNTWVHHTTLSPEPGVDLLWYGGDVALLAGPERAWAFVAILDAQAFGAVEVYRLDGDTWVKQGVLSGSDTEYGDVFGTAIAACHGQESDWLVATARYAGPGQYGSGAVYSFRLEGLDWVEEQKFIASDPQQLANYGESISITSGPGGERMAVGCPYDRTKGDRSGAVYVYRREAGAWIEEQKVVPLDNEWGDNFGHSVAIVSKATGDRFIAGAIYDDNKGLSSGSASVFARSGFTWKKEGNDLTPADGSTNDQFGQSVALVEMPEGLTAAVGAPWRDGGDEGLLPDSGRCYLFRKEGQIWVETGALGPADPTPDARFGLGMASDDSEGEPRLLIAAPFDDANGVDSGSAYVFDLCASDCSADMNGDGEADIFDFLLFVNLFNGSDPLADCDGSGGFDLFDFLCFVSAFNAC